MSPSSAFGSAISSRMVVSSVLMFTDGSQEPYLKKTTLTWSVYILQASLAATLRASHLWLHLERVEADAAGVVNVRVIDGRREAHLWRLERVAAFALAIRPSE